MAGDQIAASPPGISRILPVLLLAFLIIGNLYTAFSHLSDLPLADEPQFYDMGRSIWLTGLPYGYSGNLWHPVLSQPLLYHHLLAAISTLPLGYLGPRLLGLFLLLGAVILICAVSRRIDKELAIWSAILMLIPPLSMQGALLVDIDGGLLVFGSALWVYAWLSLKPNGSKRCIILSLIVLLGLWMKLLIPFLWCLGALSAGVVAKRKDWIKDSLLALIAGGVLFGLTWFAYSALWGLTWQDPLTHGASKALSGGTAAWMESIAKNLVRLALWLTPAWLLLIIMPKRLKDSQFTPLLFSGWLIILVYLFLGVTAFGFPKYFPPTIPLLAIALAPTLKKAHDQISPVFIPILVAITAIGFILTSILGDPLLPVLTATRAGIKSPELIASLITLAVPLLFAISVWVWKKSLISFRIALLCGAAGLGCGIMQAQANAGYEVRYIYGENGLKELLSDLEAKIPPDSQVIIPADIAFLTEYRYHFRQAESTLESPVNLKALLADEKTRALVIRESYLAHAPYAKTLNALEITVLLKNYHMDILGSFYLYYR